MYPPPIERVVDEVARMLMQYAGYKTTLDQVSTDWAHDPFRVLISTILSHRTKDEVTAAASDRLFRKFEGPQALAAADEREIDELIRPVGFYHMKAKRVKEVAEIIVGRFHGVVPRDMESLLSLPAVGRKTANCVLVYGFNKPAIPVDTHVHRISNRLNLVQTLTPEETERHLVATVDRRFWLNINDMFVRFGRTLCRPVGPKCELCSLKPCCAYYVVKVAPNRGQ
jgi:endonuclease-3